MLGSLLSAGLSPFCSHLLVTGSEQERLGQCREGLPEAVSALLSLTWALDSELRNLPSVLFAHLTGHQILFLLGFLVLRVTPGSCGLE